MIRSVLEENVRRAGANIDLADAYSQLDLQCWKPYLDWNPDGLTFESYAFGILRRRAFDHYRQLLGRRGEKPLANAFPLVYSDDGELTDLPPSEDALRSLDLAEALAVR
jgi:DNA-directed RNA polymerase specialized sigma24 family protein